MSRSSLEDGLGAGAAAPVPVPAPAPAPVPSPSPARHRAPSRRRDRLRDRRRDRLRGRRPGRGSRSAVPRVLAAALALLAVAAIAWSTPAIRYQLRASFTRLPAGYTELYFTGQPAVQDSTAVVPVGVLVHGTRPRTCRLRVTLVSAAGRTTAQTTVAVTARPGHQAASVVRLPAGGGAAEVRVLLVGHSQSLHYRLTTRSLTDSQGAP